MDRNYISKRELERMMNADQAVVIYFEKNDAGLRMPDTKSYRTSPMEVQNGDDVMLPKGTFRLEEDKERKGYHLRDTAVPFGSDEVEEVMEMLSVPESMMEAYMEKNIRRLSSRIRSGEHPRRKSYN